MTRAAPPIPAHPALAASPVRALIETTKPGITRLVTITAMAGLMLQALTTRGLTLTQTLTLAAGCLVGTALSASGANAFNQWAEMRRDARMHRTRARPLPSSRLEPATVAWFGAVLTVVGVLALALVCGPVPAMVSLACAAVYLFAYTPLKPVSAWNTLVGAIPGALPPMIGTAAASLRDGYAVLLEPLGLALFALMMVWQLPHFFAIAWLHRDDYERGGFRMLSLNDPDGARTARTVLFTALLLAPAAAAPALATPLLSWPYAAVALISTGAFVLLCARFLRSRTRDTARAVFLASIAHLPVLMLAMLAEATLRAAL